MYTKKYKLIVCLILALCILYSSIMLSAAEIGTERCKGIDTQYVKLMNQEMLNQFLLNSIKKLESDILDDMKSKCKYVKAFNFEKVSYNLDTGILLAKCFFRAKNSGIIDVSASGHIVVEATAAYSKSINKIGLVEVKCTRLDINNLSDWVEDKLDINKLIGKKLPHTYWPDSLKVSDYVILNNDNLAYVINCYTNEYIGEKIKPHEISLQTPYKLYVSIDNVNCTKFDLKSGLSEFRGNIVVIYNEDSSGSVKYPIGKLNLRLDVYLDTRDNNLVFGVTPKIELNDVSDKINNTLSEQLTKELEDGGKYIKLITTYTPDVKTQADYRYITVRESSQNSLSKNTIKKFTKEIRYDNGLYSGTLYYSDYEIESSKLYASYQTGCLYDLNVKICYSGEVKKYN